jgi:prohibitin 2
LGKDFDERVLPSIVNEVTKAVVARFNASELLTKREEVSSMILTMLTKRAADFHILLDDVSITHLAFSKDYTAAVEAKQVCDCVVFLHIILIQCLMVLLWYDH